MNLTVKEYAKKEKISEQAVRKRIKSGSIEAERNGKSWIITSNETENNLTKPHSKPNETKNNQESQHTKLSETKNNLTKPHSKPNETKNNQETQPTKPSEAEINQKLKSIKQQGHETQSNVLALYKNDKVFLKELQEIKDEHSKNINRISKNHQIQIISILIAVIVGSFLLLLQYQKSQDISLEREKSLQEITVQQKDDFKIKESELKNEISTKETKFQTIGQELKENVKAHSETKTKLAVLETQHQVSESEKKKLAEEKSQIEKMKKKLEEEVIELKLKLLQQAAIPSGNQQGVTSSNNISL